MANKKDYQDVLKILSAMATRPTTYNKLAALAVDTDDANLKKMASTFAKYIRPNIGDAPGPKMCMERGVSMLINSNDASRKTHGNNILIAIKYCTQAIESIEPDWMIKARAAGWTPPPSPSL